MKNEKVTIADIAHALNVSTISVSRALSGQPGVGSGLRDRIVAKAREMGYLKPKCRSDIKILVLHQKPYIQDNSNFSYKVQGIESAIQSAGIEYNVEFIDKAAQNKMCPPSKLSKGGNFDGIIFIGRFNPEYADFLRREVKSQIFYTGYAPSFDCDSVWYNFNNGGYKACRYLIEKGHQNLAFIGNGNYRSREKLLGITAAMDDFGIPVSNEYILNSNDNAEDGFLKLMKKEQRPTAVICDYDFTAIRLIKTLYENGLKVPEDISIIGSGNSEMSALSIPSLTTLDMNIEYSCRCTVELLLKRINNPDKPYESILINSDLIVRDSVKDCGGDLNWGKS